MYLLWLIFSNFHLCPSYCFVQWKYKMSALDRVCFLCHSTCKMCLTRLCSATSLGTWDRGLWMVLLLLAELTSCLSCNTIVKNPYITIFLLTNRLLGCLSFKDLVFELGSGRHQYLSRLDIPMLKNIQVSWTGFIFGRLIFGSYFKVCSLGIPFLTFNRNIS